MIPKIIHYCWFGNGEMPEKDIKNIEGWKKLNPDYEIKRWDESNYDIKKCPYMREAYKAGKLGFVPDYARTDIIFTYGGFYFDTDVELLKPLDQFLDEKCIMGFEHKKSVNHGHGFAAEPGAEVLRLLLEEYHTRSFVKQDGSLDLTSSPVILTELLTKHGLVLNNKEQFVLDAHIYPTEIFCPKDFMTGLVSATPRTVSIHHFNLSWMNQADIAKMKECGVLKRKYGSFIARNIVDFRYAYREEGIKGCLMIFVDKVKRKIVKGN